jgi:hypothetical protein
VQRAGTWEAGLANQDVTQKLDQVFPRTERGNATENSGSRRQESRGSLVTLEQVERVCKVAGQGLLQ